MFWSNQPSCSSPSFNSPLFYHHPSPSLMCSCSKVQPACPWEWGHLLECWQLVGGFWGGKNHIVFTFSFLLTEAPCMGLTVPDCLTDMAFLPQLPVYRKVNRQGLSCRVPEYCVFILSWTWKIGSKYIVFYVYLYTWTINSYIPKAAHWHEKIENKCCL